MNAPTGICENCWRVYRSRKPRPQVVYCWHSRAAAKQTQTGWRVLDGIGDTELAEMRAKGML